MTRILIVDDEAPACNILSILIQKVMQAEYEIRSFQDPNQALEALPQYKPDLVMLDIEMPGMNGFDFLNRAGASDFDVIFTTAYDKYAIKAIRFSALDYLLKPVDSIELQNALNRHIVRRLNVRDVQRDLVHNLMENVQKSESDEYRLAVSTAEGVFFYLPSEIIRCEGENNYTTIYVGQVKPLIVSRTLKDFESILADYGFLRVHKSHLVNMKYVTRIDRDGGLWLQNGDHIPVSRRRKEEVMHMLRRK